MKYCSNHLASNTGARSSLGNGLNVCSSSPAMNYIFQSMYLKIKTIKQLYLFMILKELQRRSTEDATTTVAAMIKENAPKNGGTCIPCTLTKYILKIELINSFNSINAKVFTTFLDDFNRVKLLTVTKNDYINSSLLLVSIKMNIM